MSDRPRDGDAPDPKAVLCAHALLLIESAKLYGLIMGGPKIHADRCEEMIARGNEHGISFDKKTIEQAASQMMAEMNAEAG